MAGVVLSIFFVRDVYKRQAVAKSGNDITLSFGGNTITLPKEKGEALEKGGYVGKEVTLGIRPEDLHDDEASLAAAQGSVITATVRVYEMLGAEVFLYFDVEDTCLLYTSRCV